MGHRNFQIWENTTPSMFASRLDFLSFTCDRCLQDVAFFSHEDQEFGEGIETIAKSNPVKVAEFSELLTVNQILESVVETTRQVGRISFHTAADASYKQMTLHCENLLMGKQQKISSLLNSQLPHESSVNCSPRQHDEEIKIATFHPMINSAFHTEVEVPLLTKEFDMKSPRTPVGTMQTQWYSETTK